jgi:hypothetical protein
LDVDEIGIDVGVIADPDRPRDPAAVRNARSTG